MIRGSVSFSAARSWPSPSYPRCLWTIGSMGPKIQAAVWFLEAGGSKALITNPENLERALAGETGTWIVPAPCPGIDLAI